MRILDEMNNGGSLEEEKNALEGPRNVHTLECNFKSQKLGNVVLLSL